MLMTTRMIIAADIVAKALALPEGDRALLARQLIASLDENHDLTPKCNGTR